MEPFQPHYFYSIGKLLDYLATHHGSHWRPGSEFYGELPITEKSESPLSDVERGDLQRYIEAINAECVAVKLKRSSQLAQSLIGRIDENRELTNRYVAGLLAELDKHIRMDMQEQLFLYMSPVDAEYYNNEKLLGDAVYDSFPDARIDVLAAGNCLACGNDTAAVFHLMRVAEWGLRALCIHFGFKKVKEYKNKTGKYGLIPIQYSMWEKMLNQLEKKTTNKIAKLQRGSAKQKLQEFYNPLVRDIRAIKDTWRNHVMHSRAEYGHEDALAALAHVKDIMTALASRGVKQV